uniref:Uncharacterized protein n=1 Tax=Podoviridae sp. ctf5T2 TaxID=2827743 RepID=A0A8S5SMQ6_9CAUD|nr:MAG TPA: hypothetical protein [Podoviridae sp. ctf5T2]
MRVAVKLPSFLLPSKIRQKMIFKYYVLCSLFS